MPLKKSQRSLKDWGSQKWRTSDGKPSKGKKRYLPDKAWKALSASEKAATNRAKAKGNKKGKQFNAQRGGGDRSFAALWIRTGPEGAQLRVSACVGRWSVEVCSSPPEGCLLH